MLVKTYNSVGFTLIELLVVIAITMSLAALSLPTFANLQSSTILKDSTDQVVQAIRVTKNYSCAGKHNSDHGIYFENNGTANDKVIIFSGNSYQDRNTLLDEEIIIEANVSVSNTFIDNQLIFYKNSCMPNQTGIVNIGSNTIETNINISVNSLGIANNIIN